MRVPAVAQSVKRGDGRVTGVRRRVLCACARSAGRKESGHGLQNVRRCVCRRGIEARAAGTWKVVRITVRGRKRFGDAKPKKAHDFRLGCIGLSQQVLVAAQSCVVTRRRAAPADRGPQPSKCMHGPIVVFQSPAGGATARPAIRHVCPKGAFARDRTAASVLAPSVLVLGDGAVKARVVIRQEMGVVGARHGRRWRRDRGWGWRVWF